VAKKSRDEVVLQVRCDLDVKIAFKTLAAKLDDNYEETLKQLMEMEKTHPLMKRTRGILERL
jgi:hypothetical protein